MDLKKINSVLRLSPILTAFLIFQLLIAGDSKRAAAAAKISLCASLLKKGDALMKKRDLKSYESALALYDSALSECPDNIDAMIKNANALCHIMRVKTNGNIILYDGSTQDSEENKKIWKEYGQKAVTLIRRAIKERPEDPLAVTVNAESYMYYMSSFGVLQAIFDGAVGQYKKNAAALLECSSSPVCSNLGDIYMGIFYLITPWPLSDYEKAGSHFKKALELDPASPAAHYNMGIHAFCNGNYQLAIDEFSYVTDNSCGNGQEADYCGFMKMQAQRGTACAKREIKDN